MDAKLAGRARVRLLLRRYAAFLLDLVFLLPWAGVLYLLSPVVGPWFQRSAGQAELAGLLLLVLPVYLYLSLFEGSRWQATPAKRLLRLRVESTQRATLTLGGSLWRNLVKLIPWEFAHFAIWHALFPASALYDLSGLLLAAANLLLVVWAVFPLLQPQARALHDLAAGTRVRPATRR